MTIKPESCTEMPLPLRGVPGKGWCWQDNELYTVFLPIIGAYAVVIYCTLTAMSFCSPSVKYSIRALAESTQLSATTVLRALEMTESVGLIRLRKGSGSQRSICELVDPKTLAKSLGAVYESTTASFVLPTEAVERLKADVSNRKKKQQGKADGTGIAPRDFVAEVLFKLGESVAFDGPKRNAGVSQVIRQRTIRGTQTGSHLLQEERRIEEESTPTPFHDCEAQEPKGSSVEDEPSEQLKCAQNAFIGVIDDIRSQLLDTNRPPRPHLANGFAEWEKFGFNSFAVEAASRHGDTWALVLSASNVEAAKQGVEKYHWRWNGALRAWFGGHVYIQWQPDQQK